ncbi:MAG: metal-dependent hydrolase [Kangiellaceae bacterium]|nr:metal-dependent hydrolase [Kangiellaceae bacterium]
MISKIDHQKQEIKPRHMDFPFFGLKDLKFVNGNIYKSAFIAGLSASFPAGEQEFVDSVRNYRDKISNVDLQNQVKGFIGQEGHHSHQHRLVNQELDRLGYQTGKVDQLLKDMIDRRVKKLDNKWRLALTVAAEHVTAIMGEYILDHPKFLDGMEKPFKDLLLWHAVEEIEHKSVAFDVYMECEGDIPFLHKATKISTRLIHLRLTRNMFVLAFRTKYWTSWKDFSGCMSWMFGKNGMWRTLRAPYKTFFTQDFHPWRDGGLELINKWQEEYYQADQDKNSLEYLQAHTT